MATILKFGQFKKQTTVVFWPICLFLKDTKMKANGEYGDACGGGCMSPTKTFCLEMEKLTFSDFIFCFSEIL